MQTIITAIAIYALKATIALTLLYIPYILFMRRETHFRTNRTTLLLAMLLSLATPLIDIPALHIENPFATTEEKGATFIQITPPQGTILADNGEENTKSLTQQETAYYFLCLPYIIIALIIATKKLFEICMIKRNIKRGTLWKEERTGYTIYCHATDTTPYSWMKSIVISQEDYEKFGKEIILHEEGHILHRHSWDIILLTITETIQWFNPFMHMLSTDLKDLHEFQADAYVLAEEKDIKSYQMLIIKKAVGHASYTLANSFNHSKLKKRITMMLKKKSNPVRCATALYILPAAALTLSIFATPQETVGNNLAVEHASMHKSSETFVKNDTVGDKIYQVCEKAPEYPGGMKALMKYLSANTHYPDEARKNNIQGKSHVQFIVETNGSISDVKIVKSAGDESLDKEAVRVVASMPKWQPGTQSGKNVRVQYTLPINFRIQKPQAKPAATESPIKVQVSSIPKDAKKSDIVFEVCENLPQFPGGTTALMKYLSANTHYPEEALKNNIQGKSHVQFIVETDGSISNMKITKSSGNELLDKEAVRVVASMPKWQPGTQSGKKVRVKYTLPVMFRLM